MSDFYDDLQKGNMPLIIAVCILCIVVSCTGNHILKYSCVIIAGILTMVVLIRALMTMRKREKEEANRVK